MKKKNKDKVETDFSSLLVFGYGCKIFRDDQRALSVEAGDHLIPWMGDPSLRIDRYDGRGHLHNLAEYESRPGARLEDDDLERHEEELCEEERWRALHHDDSEDAARAEEEAKRAGEAGAGAQFQYNYGESGEAAAGVVFGPEAPGDQETAEEEDEEYVVTPELDLPPGVTPPATLKQFSVIEKTALLIARQGAQMEILLKTKQSGNPVFDFLSLDHGYNKFYKHLLMLVKTKQYRRHTPPPAPAAAPPRVSLVPQYSEAAPDLAPGPRVPAVPYKRSEDCAYSQLINKLQKFAPAPAAAAPPPPISSPPVLSKESSPAPAPGPPQVEMPGGPIVIPPGDLQTVIDKTASYVAKNGRSFEDIVFSKDKSRFSFLKPGDRHYNYYLHKLNIYLTGNYDPKVSAEPLAFKLNKIDNSKETKVTANNPISGLDYSSGSDNDGADSPSETAESNEEKDKKTNFPNLVGFLPPTITSNPKLYSDPSEEDQKKESEEQKKRHEENNKLRDKLAAKAREKMVQVAKEKALQLERKRKAAQFLAQLAEKKTTVSSVTAVSEDRAGDSSAEEGELPRAAAGDCSSHERLASDQGESVSAVTSWPPPAPPKLVIPQLAGPTPANPVVELSSDSEDERPKKRKRRSRSRSRHRRGEKSRRKRRSRSRSRHKKSKRKDRRKYSSGERDSERRHKKRRHRYSSSDSDSDRSRRRKRSDIEESESEDERPNNGNGNGNENDPSNQIIEDIVKPKVNAMTEELRAKVRAMLDNK